MRRDGEHYEIISNGVFLMDTRAGESERLLARAPLDLLAGPARVLIGGLGVGFTLAAALAHPVTAAVTVVEVEPAVVSWQHRYLGAGIGRPLADPRVSLVEADLMAWLAADTGRFDVVCLDVDNGPGWTVTDGNARLYSAAGLDLVANRMTRDGVLAVWSAQADEAFRTRLGERFAAVRTLAVPVARGEPDVVFLAGSAAVLSNP